MAARVRKIRHDDETRAKIQAAQIINRFQKCIMGEIDLTSQQVSCGKALLDKVLPNLQATELSGEMEHQINTIERRIVQAKAPSGDNAQSTPSVKGDE